jgi:trk system potassium uptake protein TrkH
MLSGSPGPDWSLGLAFFHSVVARSAGFSVGGGFAALSPASQFLTLLLMFIGAAPASMGGGITTGTAAVLGLALISYIRNRFEPTVAGRSIPAEVVRRATAVLIAAMLVVTVATWLLLLSHPQVGLLSALFEVISAFATCGLSLAFTRQLNGFGLGLIMLVMFWGRLGALTVVAALARRSTPPLVRYPEENIMIG